MTENSTGDETVTSFTDRRRAQLRAVPDTTGPLQRPHPIHPVPAWLAAPSVTGGALSPDGQSLAFVSDRDGLPALWVAPLDGVDSPVRLDTGPDHVRQVSWSPDGRWLTCLLAPFGGEQTRVVALRPDGSELRTLAGGPAGTGAGPREPSGDGTGGGGAGTLGAWRPDGALVGVSEACRHGRGDSTAYAIDPATGRRTELATGPAAVVCAFSPNGRHAVVRVGRRGTRQLLWVDIWSGRRTSLLVDADATVADARFVAGGTRLYVHTDSGRDRAALLELTVGQGGPRRRARPRVLAARPDADLDLFATHGDRLLAVWNEHGHSALELLEPGGGAHRLPAPAEVVTSCAFSPDGGWLLIGAEGPTTPPHLVRCRPGSPLAPAPDTAELDRLAPAEPPGWAPDELVSPVLLRFTGADGLELSGWWYAPHGGSGAGPTAVPDTARTVAQAEAAQQAGQQTGRPTVLWLHGGPESQERPAFAPLLQSLAAAGVAVFAPNVRGSSGYGRDFVNADNGALRFAAITDVAEATRFLVETGLAEEHRIGIAGRSYGGYLTLAALVHFPELFRVGVDVCGMADLETFFAYTEPWIATAATSKYGDPSEDGALLRELSPLHRIERLVAPLLVVHGEHDTNVPLVEAEQVVHALRERGAAPGLLLFPDEGHEIHGTANRVTFVREVVQWLTSHLLEADEQTA
ncbi:MAG TPA: S9 family peptidase [Pseudonocardia sp.]|nr:S9 family peptidase [Pseudonocardia sp.]